MSSLPPEADIDARQTAYPPRDNSDIGAGAIRAPDVRAVLLSRYAGVAITARTGSNTDLSMAII
jgi:hypothetical protein